jgi:hypothetical protein
LRKEIESRDELLKEFEEECGRMTQRLNWAEEERRKTLEFLQEQDSQIKEFKDKFFELAEEAGKYKASLRLSSSLLARYTRLFFNLMNKFSCQVHQKQILYLFFNKYMSLKNRLVESEIIVDTSIAHIKNEHIYKRFRRVGYAIIAANRLRKQRKLGNSSESYELRASLKELPSSLSSFMISLFRENSFELDDTLLNNYEALLSVENNDDEILLSQIILSTNSLYPLSYTPTPSQKYTNPNIFTEHIIFREDFVSKFGVLDEKLQRAEDFIRNQEDYFKGQLEMKLLKIDALTEENKMLRQSNLNLEEEYKLARKQAEEMIGMMDKNTDVVS